MKRTMIIEMVGDRTYMLQYRNIVIAMCCDSVTFTCQSVKVWRELCGYYAEANWQFAFPSCYFHD